MHQHGECQVSDDLLFLLFGFVAGVAVAVVPQWLMNRIEARQLHQIGESLCK